jgi:hypothetical protein
VRGAITVLTIGMLGSAGAAGGCVDRTPPPHDVPVPQGPGQGGVRSDDFAKPMPRPDDEDLGGGRLPPPPFDDAPLVTQEFGEQGRFVEAYEAVGRPRIVVFVNRTLGGELLPVNDADPYVSVERRRTARGDVTVETRRRDLTDDFRRRDDREATDRFESRGDGPAEFRDRLDVYLRPGQYDEALARQVDYEAIENVLTDWLACGGRTEVVSPLAARRRLTEAQVKELEAGRGSAMNDLVRALDADVLVHVTARPTRQTTRGLEVRLVAEAINSRGGQSIGRAVVPLAPPLDKPRINRATRFVARKLMDGMMGAWENMPPDREGGPGRGAPPGEARPAAGEGLPPSEPRGGAAPFAGPPATDADPGPADRTLNDGDDDRRIPPPPPLPGPRPETLPPDVPAPADEEPGAAIEADATAEAEADAN